MSYLYNTPQEAIISLENAYTNQDIDAIIASKDFETEARLLLQKHSIPITKDIVKETIEILQLSLIKHLNENGYPNFENAVREFSDK